MLQDALSGNVDYKVILVYDVSRWGRFQDLDESAYYEFICKNSGIPVHYCAEQFTNDASQSRTILKALKRSMAAEFSRELGDKVFQGKARLAKLGFWMGGDGGFGYLDEPWRTMVLVGMCLGLRVSEILGLQWSDFDFAGRTVLVQRAWVVGKVGDVKTRYSKKRIPLDRSLVTSLLSYRAKFEHCEWLFANPDTNRPWWAHHIQQEQILPAAVKANLGRIGWHTFRHTYSSMLRHLGVDVKVQQELLRHADIRTTMNVYTQAMPAALRQANSKVARLVVQ